MRLYHPLLAVAAVLIAILISIASALLPQRADAAPLGLRFPALAGTQWKAAAGYNTATHLGVDPYALDLAAIGAGDGVVVGVEGKATAVSARCGRRDPRGVRRVFPPWLHP